MLDKIILKSPPQKKFLDTLSNHTNKYMYFPIVKTLEEIELVKSQADINLVGLELIAVSENSELFNRNLIERLKSENYFIFVNAEKLMEGMDLFAGYDDDKSLREGFDVVWGVLLDMGVDVIQTDWTNLLNMYRNERSG